MVEELLNPVSSDLVDLVSGWLDDKRLVHVTVTLSGPVWQSLSPY